MAEQLLAALHALYHHTDPNVKEQANKWLEQWQQGVEAWSVSDQVLHDAASTMEAQYFCAQTLRTKVLKLHCIRKLLHEVIGTSNSLLPSAGDSN